ncbi:MULTISPECIES: hypothetical protein [unclassified Caulobacter]|nr:MULTISPECIES: hypothetical protein [unclassified Caulobacter]
MPNQQDRNQPRQAPGQQRQDERQAGGRPGQEQQRQRPDQERRDR